MDRKAFWVLAVNSLKFGVEIFNRGRANCKYRHFKEKYGADNVVLARIAL